MAEEKIRVKINKKQIALFLAIFGVIVAGALGYLAYIEYLQPVMSVEFNGETLAFREDLRQAQNVEVIPSEEALRSQMDKPPNVIGPSGQIIVRKPLRNVTIVFKSVSSETMGWYTVQVSEIIKKMTALYKGKYNVDVNFAIAETENYDELRGSNTAPIIALVHPQIANGTFVEVDGDRNVVTISGGDSLRDFDLATIKFLMTTLGIEI